MGWNPLTDDGRMKRTVVTNPKLEHASSSHYTRISTPRISVERKKSQDHGLSLTSKWNHHEPLVPSKGLQPLTLHTNFQSGTMIPIGRASSINMI